MDFTNATVLIAGLGVSGTSLAEVLAERGARVIGVDERKPTADLHSFDEASRRHGSASPAPTAKPPPRR